MDDGANLNLVVKRLFSLFFFPCPLSLPNLRFSHHIPSETSFFYSLRLAQSNIAFSFYSVNGDKVMQGKVALFV